MYGVDDAAQGVRAAEDLGKVLRGARPGEIPIEHPAKYELVLNLRTARALSLTVPPAVIARATEVIQGGAPQPAAAIIDGLHKVNRPIALAG